MIHSTTIRVSHEETEQTHYRQMLYRHQQHYGNKISIRLNTVIHCKTNRENTTQQHRKLANTRHKGSCQNMQIKKKPTIKETQIHLVKQSLKLRRRRL